MTSPRLRHVWIPPVSARQQAPVTRALAVLASLFGSLVLAVLVGLLSAGSASADPLPPDAPNDLAVSPSDGSLLVTWTPPVSDGGATITGYDVSAWSSTLGSGATVEVAGDQSSALVTGLQNRNEYVVTVVALNAAGQGAPTLARATPRTVPGAPARVSVSAIAGGVAVSWAAPTDDGGSPVSSYVIGSASGTGLVVDGAARSATLTGLTNGVMTTVTVAAVNDAGSGPATTSSTVVPRIPTRLAVLTAPATHVIYGASSSVSAVVRTDAGVGVPAVKVALLTRAAKTTATWRQVAEATSDAAGKVALKTSLAVNSELRLHLVSDFVVGPDAALPTVSVARKVSNPALTRVRLGGTSVATGSISPTAATGSTVRLQRLVGRTWTTVANGTMTSGTSYRVTWRSATAGGFYVRVLKPADATHAESVSGRATLIVDPERAIDIARQIRANRRIQLATSHSSGVRDNATATSDMFELAAGRWAPRSHYDGAPGSRTPVDLRVLRTLRSLGAKANVLVSEIAGGSHAAGSAHYSGKAFDISAVNGSPVRPGSSYAVVVSVCRLYGAAQIFSPGYDPYGGHQNHVHCGW